MGFKMTKKYNLVRKLFYPGYDDKLWQNLLQRTYIPDGEALEIGSGSGRQKQFKDYPNF